MHTCLSTDGVYNNVVHVVRAVPILVLLQICEFGRLVISSHI